MTIWPRVALLALLAAPYNADSVPLPGKYVRDINAMHDEAWRLACTFKAYDCSTLAQPQVWYTPIWGSYGRYKHDSPGIQINIGVAGETFSLLVAVHEMVHYIQNAEGANRFGEATYRAHCQREAEAFNISNAVAAWADYRDDRLTSWPDMAAQYSCGSTAFSK